MGRVVPDSTGVRAYCSSPEDLILQLRGAKTGMLVALYPNEARALIEQLQAAIISLEQPS
jgi:hypothetical protein